MATERKDLIRNCEVPENYSVLERELRFSPNAVTQLAWTSALDYKIRHEDTGWTFIVSPELLDLDYDRRWQIGNYLYSCGLCSLEDFRAISIPTFYQDYIRNHRSPWLETDLFSDQKDNYFATTTMPVRNVVRLDVANVATDLDFIRSKVDSLTVVFMHGKWNGFPHSGYSSGYIDSMSFLVNQGIDPKTIVFVAACDTNQDIRNAGHTPFFNTSWRVSLLSYLPFNFVCSSGDFEPSEASLHWMANYEALKPNYVVLDANEEMFDQKSKEVERSGAMVLPTARYRGEFDDIPEISQTSIRTGHSDMLVRANHLNQIQSVRGIYNWTTNWKKFLQEAGRL